MLKGLSVAYNKAMELATHAAEPDVPRPPIQLQGFEMAWERYHSFRVEKIRGCDNCQVWGDAYNKFMELCPVNKAIEEPVPPSDTSAERVTEKAEGEHVARCKTCGGKGWYEHPVDPTRNYKCPDCTTQPAGDDVDWPTELGEWEHSWVDGKSLRAMFAWHATPTSKRSGLIHAVAELVDGKWLVGTNRIFPRGGWRRIAPGSSGLWGCRHHETGGSR